MKDFAELIGSLFSHSKDDFLKSLLFGLQSLVSSIIYRSTVNEGDLSCALNAMLHVEDLNSTYHHCR